MSKTDIGVVFPEFEDKPLLCHARFSLSAGGYAEARGFGGQGREAGIHVFAVNLEAAMDSCFHRNDKNNTTLTLPSPIKGEGI